MDCEGQIDNYWTTKIPDAPNILSLSIIISTKLSAAWKSISIQFLIIFIVSFWWDLRQVLMRLKLSEVDIQPQNPN